MMISCLLTVLTSPAFAGPYSDETSGYIDMNDASIVAWATGYTSYIMGSNVDTQWQTPEKALGQAVGSSYDIVCLGRGGSITLTFDAPIINGPGADFAIFENSFSDTFLELAFVEVFDGDEWVRFDNNSLTQNPVGAFGTVDPSNIDGYAGKHRQGRGTLFDLEDLLSNYGDDASTLDLNNIIQIRLLDIVGDGTYTDTYGYTIYDPYPTIGSAGFDLDAIGVIHQGVASVPVPGAFWLMGSGLIGLAGLSRKKHCKN